MPIGISPVVTLKVHTFLHEFSGFHFEVHVSILGKACFIKTGTKEGPMKGKSFFICGNQLEQCSFAAPARFTVLSKSHLFIFFIMLEIILS